jgi:hypothetical protein
MEANLVAFAENPILLECVKGSKFAGREPF